MSNHGTDKSNVTVLMDFVTKRRPYEKAVINAARELLKVHQDENAGWDVLSLAIAELFHAFEELDKKQ